MQLAENSLSRLLVLFIFMLFCLEFMRDTSSEKELNIIVTRLRPNLEIEAMY